ncbi:DUF817 domain-containing protein [Parvularcula sp. ZS-1/3]|uniref:DUF817 domain-containing protein n=1 Tax=Parvularcula mediterranea TaxID=2732508 RepID=A0A7Y3RKQ0_9PROT|nr:DUF817 domain-containing protein [Parvularcula mediterranea]
MTSNQEISRVDQLLQRALVPVEAFLRSTLGERLANGLTEFLVFGIKQAWACLFGGLILAAILLTALFWPENSPVARYDFLFAYALTVQVLFLVTKLERPQEALVIFIFHAVGTAMEVFKTGAGSWTYPEASMLRIGAVPLFSGFMYAAVGSYLARCMRVFEFRFDRYPARWQTFVVAGLIYANFFAHHYLPDIRWLLLAATAWIYRRTWVHYRVWRFRHKMPLLLGFALVALFIFLAENLATLAGIWLYPDQQEVWRPVSWQKYPAWFILMILSWALVTVVHPPKSSGDGAHARG